MSNFTEKLYQLLESYSNSNLIDNNLEKYNEVAKILGIEQIDIENTHREICEMIEDDYYDSDMQENTILNTINNLTSLQLANLIKYELDNCHNRTEYPSILELAAYYNYTPVVKLLCELGFRNVYNPLYQGNNKERESDVKCTNYFAGNNNIELLNYYKNKNYYIEHISYLKMIEKKAYGAISWCKNNKVSLKAQLHFLPR